MKPDGHMPTVPFIGGYRIEERLGRGGMGEVYRALDVRLGRPVALKVLVAGQAENEGYRERLLSESRLAASLDHPHVVPVYEAGEDHGRLFIAMRYVAGPDLKDLVRATGPLDPARALRLAGQVADALDAAHRRGLVHRDVKPSNVLVDAADGRDHAYLADFGLTQSASERPAGDGHSLGTLDYVAPEQIRSDPLDGRADQYGLAALTFELLTGRPPFAGRSEVATLFAHLEEPPAPPSRAGLPRALDPVFARGLAKDPAARYPSCTAFVAAARDAAGIRPRRRRRERIVAPLAGLAMVLAALAVGTGALEGKQASAGAPGALIRIDPATGAIADRTEIPGHPGNVEITRGGIWMADFREGVIWRVQPGSRSPERITSVGEPRDLAALGEHVYVAADGRFLSGVVSRYDAVSATREDGIDLLACAIAAGDGEVWAAGCPHVQRLSTGDGRVRKLVEVFLPFRTPSTVDNTRVQFRELAVGGGSVWVLGDAVDRRLWRLDTRTGRVQATLPLDFAPTSVTFADGRAWITDGVRDRLVPVTAASNAVEPAVEVGRGAAGVAAGAGAVWVANALDGTVSRVDPGTRRVTAVIDVGGTPRGVAASDDAVWVTEHAP